MSKQSRNGCGWECCPSGFVEHVKHYRYLRQVTEEPYRTTFFEYWWHELKSLVGLNRVSDMELDDLDDDDELSESAPKSPTNRKGDI